MIHAEIGQNTLVELEAKLPRVAVIHPLPLGIIHRLAGALVFQFKGEHRDAVEHQHHIHTLFCIGGEVPLAIALDGVCRPLGSRRLIQGRLRLKIAHPKTQSTVLEAVAQDREQSLRLASRVERRAELPHRVKLIGIFKSCPLLGLGALDKVDQGIHIEPLFGVIGVCALGISARRGEKEGFYIRFKTLFGGDHNSFPLCKVILCCAY